MSETICPICGEKFINISAMEWHAFVMHLSCDGTYGTSIRRCLCGQILSPGRFIEHFEEYGGLYAHYHACLLGAEP